MQYRNTTGLHWRSHTTGSKCNMRTLQPFSYSFWQCIQVDWKGWSTDFQGTKFLRTHSGSFIWLMTVTLSERNTFQMPEEQPLFWENSECWIIPWDKRGFKFLLISVLFGGGGRLNRHMQKNRKEIIPAANELKVLAFSCGKCFYQLKLMLFWISS